MTIFHIAVIAVNVLSLFYVVLVDCLYLLQLLSSALSLGKYVKSRHYSDHERFAESENMIPISLLVPAYNEEKTIVDNVKNLLSLDYPEYELIVINDGSKDGSLLKLIDTFRLFPVHRPFKRSLQTKEVRAIYHSFEYPNLLVVDKINGGKADALNTGINLSRYPVFVSIDADSILEKESLVKIIMPFVKDHRVVGVGGIVRIASGCHIVDGELKSIDLSKKAIVNLQTVEYLRSFLTGRIGFDAMGMLLIVSGAFGAFNKQVVIDAGGYTKDCIGEDMELVVKLHRMMRERKAKYRIKFIPDPVCWTQPPENLKDLHKQRKRWQIGLLFTLFKYRDMLFNPRYGRIGMASLPYYWLFEFLGPIIELLGYITVPISFALGIINMNFFLGFFTVAVLYGIVLSIGALLLEENTFKKYPSVRQLIKLTFYAIIDNFGYRQINTLFRVEATACYQKAKHSWGTIKRERFSRKDETTCLGDPVHSGRTEQSPVLKRALFGYRKKQADTAFRAVAKQLSLHRNESEQLLKKAVAENKRLWEDLRLLQRDHTQVSDMIQFTQSRILELEQSLEAERQKFSLLERQRIHSLLSRKAYLGKAESAD